MTFFNSIILPLATTIAAILAWVAKIRWSKELQTLYDARISSTELLCETRLTSAEKQIEYHKQQAQDALAFGPQKMREYFDSIRQIDQQHLVELKKRLDKAVSEIQEREQQIQDLRTAATQKHDIIAELQTALDNTNAQALLLQETVRALVQRGDDVGVALGVVNRPAFDIDFVRSRLQYFEVDKGWAVSSARRALETKRSAREQQVRRTMEAVRQADSQGEAARQAEQSNRKSLDE